MNLCMLHVEVSRVPQLLMSRLIEFFYTAA